MTAPVGAWADVPCENHKAAPSARSVSASAVYKDCIYVFGGQRTDASRSLLNDLHEFNFTTKRWRAVPATGSAPCARSGHTCVVYKDALYVYGGHDGRGCLNDLVAYSFLTREWSVVVENGTYGAPTPRKYHSAVVYRDSLYCFSGYNSSNLKDLHRFDFATQTWNYVSVSGKVPRFRFAASLVVYKNVAILFGGTDGSVGGLSGFGDLYMFDFDERTWSTLTAEGPQPTARYGHVAVVHSNAMYVFGGQASTMSNDLYKLQLGPSLIREWKPVASRGTLPRACYYHTAGVYNSSLIVFSGHGNDNNLTQFRFEDSKLSETAVIPDSSFLSFLRGLVNNEHSSDITFIVEGSPIYAHRNLCTRCDHFKAMLSSEMLESRTREILISDVRRSIFLSFLEYLYTDDVDVAADDTMDLLVVADRYGVDRLKRICESRILDTLGVENAAMIFYAADHHNAATLRDQCVSFMVNNFDEVSKTPAFDEMSRKNVDLVLELLKLR